MPIHANTPAQGREADFRLLLVDTDDSFAAELGNMVAKCCPQNITMDRARSAQDALALINAHYYDVCFLEHLLDGKETGMDILRTLFGTTGLTAYVILTSNDSRASALEALNLGAMDYIIKNRFTEFELAKCISYTVFRKHKEIGLQKDSLSDSLTGLGNKALFEAQLAQAAERARRDDESIGVLVIDIDDFKKINDRYGHKAGDALLQQVSERIVSHTRSSDVVARIGGDEFAAILIKPRSFEDVYNIAEKIEKEIRSTPFNIEGNLIKVGASVGSAVMPDDTDKVDDLFKQADMRMYKSKKVKKSAYSAKRDYMDVVLR